MTTATTTTTTIATTTTTATTTTATATATLQLQKRFFFATMPRKALAGNSSLCCPLRSVSIVAVVVNDSIFVNVSIVATI